MKLLEFIHHEKIILAAARRFRTWWIIKTNNSIVKSGTDIHIGKCCRFWAPDYITIGNSVYIGKYVNIECNATIGNHVLLANQVALIGRHDHDIHCTGIPIRFAPQISPSMVARPDFITSSMCTVCIQDDVWIGYGAIVLTGVTIGRGSVVGAGSVVSRDVAPYDIVAGNPARQIGRRFQSQLQIGAHEHMIATGKFRSSERDDSYRIIEPGK
jgi:acetyltransferase-like isoleucine patch superfamily enzyme